MLCSACGKVMYTVLMVVRYELSTHNLSQMIGSDVPQNMLISWAFKPRKHGFLYQHISKYIKEQFTLDCWIHFSLHCKNICLHAFLLFPFHMWMRDCGRCHAQVMNDQPWIEYTAITPRQFNEHSGMGQWIYHSIVRGFYQVCFLWCLLIYFTICKSLSESAFDNQWTASFSTMAELDIFCFFTWLNVRSG